MASPARKASPSPAQPAMPAVSSAGDASLAQALNNYNPDYEFAPSEPFLLKGKYRFRQDLPLPAFSTAYANAFDVQDTGNPNAQIYGVLLPKALPARDRAIQIFEKISHPHLVKLIASGPVLWGAERRMALVFEKPQGKTLASIVEAQGKKLPESFMIEHIIRPLADTLAAIASQGVTHGRVSLNNIYFSDKVTLGEGLSEPCGASQPILYEPPERLHCEPLGKGEGLPTTDVYALGVAVTLLLYGNSLLSGVERDALISHMMIHGAYPTLMQNREPPATFQDLLKGALADEARDRWTPEYVKAWCEGSRTPSTAMLGMPDGPRSFVFQGQEYFTCRTIADALARNPEAAFAELRETRLLRWVEHSKHSHRADALERVVRAVVGEPAGKENPSLLARAVTVLDPSGPLRMSGLACYPSALGTMLAAAYAKQDLKLLPALTGMIAAELVTLWAELQPDPEVGNIQELIARLQKTRLSARMHGLGGGTERLLYDINSSLPCLSPLIATFNASSPADVMLALDTAAKGTGASVPPIDRHIAAWLASRLDLAKDIRVPGFDAAPSVNHHPALIALMLFEGTLRKIGNLKLPGLGCWLVQFLLPILSHFKSLPVRDRLRERLIDLARHGNILTISSVLIGSRPMESDSQKFYDAQARYAACSKRIAWLNHPDVIMLESVRLGYGLARMIAWIIIMSVTYITVTHQIPW